MADENDDNIPAAPPNPFESAGDGDPFANGNGNGNEDNGEQMAEGTPGVASKAGKTFVVLGVVGVVVLFLLFSIFGSDDQKVKKKDDQQTVKVAPKSNVPPPLPVIEEPKMAALPPTIAVPNIPVPASVPDLNLNPLAPKDDSAEKAQSLARMRSTMMLKDGGGGGGLSSVFGGGTPAATVTNDPNGQFAAAVGRSQVETVEATRVPNLNRTIAQGRIIHATMESALNTDLPAPIRAIVSRDTYGEAGKTPLIPKGSRLIGQYNSVIASGQTRVFVVWTRVIRPDGIDIQLGSPLVDQIGQAGVSGQIDSKFQQIFSRALLASVMNIAVAIGSDKVNGGKETSTVTSTTGTQTTGDGATTATTNALNRLGAVTDGFIQRFLNVPPTILVDQGTVVNVFVNKDLVFPADLTGAAMIN